MTERCVEMAATGAVEEEGGNTADTNDGDTTAAAPPTSLAEQLRLAERGVTVHDISGDESEDEALLDEKDDEVDGGGGDAPAATEDASAAALLDTTTDQEGLVLTGGDWFKTIKNAAENNIETEKELAERMKKAKISQKSQATLENEVFEGNPPTPRPADAGPLVLQKIAKISKIPLPVPPPAPPLAQKNTVPPHQKDGCSHKVGTSFNFPPRVNTGGSIPSHTLTQSSTSKRKQEDGNFPPQYSSIRASRANAAPILPLGGIAGLGRDTVRIGIGTAVGGFDVADDTRQFSVQNYHLVGQRRNVSSTVSMPPIGGPDPMGCLSCSESHSLTESLSKGTPIVIVLSDQAFPPVLPPVGDGRCVVIMRVEDCELKELEDVLYDRFKNYSKPHGVLPPGSVILVGSMAHLSRSGLNAYAPMLVETLTRIAGKMGPGISVMPYIPVPIGGVGSDTLVRDMIDLDCWILSTGAGHNSCLPDSREMFWRLVLDPARGGRRVYTSTAPLSLPAGIRNPRIKSFVSGAFDRPIPANITPFTENEEKTIICTVFTELNEKFCVGLDNPPSFSRSIAAPPTVHSNGRTVFVGGSNLGKIAKAAAEKGSLVVDLTASGWSPKPGNIKKVAEILKNLDLKPCDTIVIDAMANSAYFGTDENGLPMPPAKSGEDAAVFKANFKQIETLLEHGGGARLVILVPMPRYVRNPCCDDGGHVTNQGEKEFYEELLSAEKRLLDAAAAGDRTREAKVIDLCKLFGSAETPLQELTTPDGTSVWAGDGVHLTSPAYRVAARLLAAELERAAMGEAGEPASKRQRLESVVPAPAPPPVRPAAKAPPPKPKPVAPPLWLSGQLPSAQKFSNNRDSGYGYGGSRGGGGRGRGRGRGGSRGKN